MILCRYNGWKYVGELFEKYVPNKEAYILCVGAGTGLEGVRLAQLGYKNMDAHDGSAEMLKVTISADCKCKRVVRSPRNVGYLSIACTSCWRQSRRGASSKPTNTMR